MVELPIGRSGCPENVDQVPIGRELLEAIFVSRDVDESCVDLDPTRLDELPGSVPSPPEKSRGADTPVADVTTPRSMRSFATQRASAVGLVPIGRSRVAGCHRRLRSFPSERTEARRRLAPSTRTVDRRWLDGMIRAGRWCASSSAVDSPSDAGDAHEASRDLVDASTDSTTDLASDANSDAGEALRAVRREPLRGERGPRILIRRVVGSVDAHVHGFTVNRHVRHVRSHVVHCSICDASNHLHRRSTR